MATSSIVELAHRKAQGNRYTSEYRKGYKNQGYRIHSDTGPLSAVYGHSADFSVYGETMVFYIAQSTRYSEIYEAIGESQSRLSRQVNSWNM